MALPQASSHHASTVNPGWVNALLNDTIAAVLVLDTGGRVAVAGPGAQQVEELLGRPVLQRKLPEIFPGLEAGRLSGRWGPLRGVPGGAADLIGCLWPSSQQPAMLLVCNAARLTDLQRGLHEQQDMNRELHAIMATSYDVIYVSDGQGNTLRVSAAAERLFGLKEADLVGKNVRDLERQGVFRPSATVRVLDTQKPVTVIQDTLAGRRLLVYSTPIHDEQGHLVRVVNTSRDITEVNQLQLQLEETRQRAARYLSEVEELRQYRDANVTGPEGPVVRSTKMKEVITLARQVAEVDSTVLLLGESGVGKEVIARLIHRYSPRRERAEVMVNCGAIPHDLLESEFFGYERGAFTGANREGKPGLFELANGGTLFLDEVAELPPQLQVKLLRALQEREITRVGGIKPLPVDIRVIAATNRNLEEMARTGRFREDLYYRLNVVPVHIPALRERREEIAALVHHFLERFNARYGRQVRISTQALEALERHDWPGNVRELENVIERMVVVGNSQTVEVGDLPQAFRPQAEVRERSIRVRDIIPLKQAIEEVEAQLILDAYAKYANTYKVAAVLGINQSTVVRKLGKYRGNAPGHSDRMPGRIRGDKRS